MRIPFRSVATLLMAVGVATCSDAPSALVGTHPVPRRAVGRLGFEPQFSRSAQALYEQRNEFGVHFDSVHVVIRGYPDTTVIVKDTTIFFADTSTTARTLDIDVPVQTDGQRFSAALAYEDGHTVVFAGSGVVQSHAPDKPAPPDQQTITINYAGPGKDATRIAISPKSSSIRADEAAAFTLSAFDGSNNPTTLPPIDWTVSDPALAIVTNISNAGATVVGRRTSGSVTVTATAASGASDQATVTFSSPPSGIVLVSGGGQSGKVGAALPQPAVVRVVALDGSGVPDVTVIFAAPAGGSVGSASVVTDAAGNASTSLKLGTAVGTQGFAATALGFSVGISESATAGAPAAMTLVSGDAQTDTVGHTLKAPLVVKVADSFGNPVSGATVAWSRTGSGTLASATSTTGNDGTASVGYTLGKSAGSDEIDAAVNGVTGAVKFTETAVAGSAAKIEIVSGDKQHASAGKQLTAPLVVQVSDAGGNPASGAIVTWSAASGTISASTVADSKGVAQNTLTLGKTVGDVTVTASVGAGKSVTFTATALPGPAAAIAFGAQPTSVAAGATMPSVTATLTDEFGNLTNAAGSVTLALGNNPGNATLSGTLTKTVANGVATFDDLKLDKAASGYTLIANGGGFTATSNAFNVTVGAPAQLRIVGSTALTLAAGSASGLPQLLVSDVSGNGIGNVSVHVVVTEASPARTIADTTVTTSTDGTFDFNQYKPEIKKAGTFTVTSSVTGLPPATFTVTVTPAAASKLVFLTWPASSNAGSPLAPQPQVEIVDAFGNVVSSATDAVTLTIQPGTGTSGAALSGTTTVNAVNGVATFTGLSIDKAGTGYCLEASAGTLTKSCSAPFDIAGSTAPGALSASTSSVSIQAGSTIGAGTITLKDGAHSPVVGASVTLTVKFAGSPVTGLTPRVLTTDATGAVSLTSLTAADLPNKAGTYSIDASAPGVSPLSVALVVNPAAASRIAITTQPASSATSGVVLDRQPVLQIQDQFGNATTIATPVTATVSAGSLGGTTSMTPTAGGGVAFTNLSITAPAGAVTLSFSGTGVGSATSSAITIRAGTATQLVLSPASPTTFTVPAGSNPVSAPVIRSLDAAGNPVGRVPVHFVVDTGTAPASATVSVIDTATDASGVLAFAGNLPTIVGLFHITATSGAISGATVTATVAITPAAAAKIAFFTPDGTTAYSAQAGASIVTPAIAVVVEDQFGNVVTSQSGTGVTVAIANNPASGTLTGTLTRNTSTGVAVFPDLKIDKAAIGYTLTATASGLGTATSRPINISAGSANKLAFTVQPTDVVANTAIAPAIIVQVQDQFGNVVDTTIAGITLARASGPTSATLSGAAESATHGNATFASVKLDFPGTYTLAANATGLASATSSSFAVSAATASSLSLASGSPSSATITAGGTIATAPSVVVKDGRGIPVAGASVTLTVKSGSTPVSGLTPRTITTDATGTVSLSALTASDLPKTVGAYSIEASSGALTPVTVGLTVSAGAPSTIKLVPSNAAPPGGAEIAIVAEAADAFGNVATDNTTRTIRWTMTAGAADGATTTSMQSGVTSLLFVTSTSSATVTATDQSNGLSLGSVTITPGAAGMSLAASGAALATSATVNTSAGAPAAKVTTTGGAAVSGVLVKFAIAGGGGKVVFGSPVDAATKQTDASGVTSLTAWNMGTIAGSLKDTLKITAAGTSDVITDVATATPGTTTQLSISGVGASVAANNRLGTITVTLSDAFGNVATNASGNVTMSLSGGATSTLNGTATAAVAAGIATFSDLSVPTAGTGYTLEAAFGSVTATSSSFEVTGQTATHLRFVQQPSAVTSLASISPAITVEVLDASNTRVTSSNASVTLALHAPGGAVLAGTLTQTAVNGLATFSNLTVDLAGSYTLDARASGLTGETSNSFSVSAGAPAALSLSHGGGVDAPASIPDDSSFSSNGHSGPKVQVVDAAGNPVSIARITVNAGVEDDLAGSAPPGPNASTDMFFAPSITATSAVTGATGVADFSGARLKGTVGGVKIHFTATYNGVTLTDTRTSHVDLKHGRGRTMSHEVSLPSWVTPGHKLSMQPKVQLLDIDGNVVDGASIHLSFDPSGGGGDLLGGSPTSDVTTDSNGEATIPTWAVGNAGFHTLWADLSTDNSVRADATVNSAAPHHIALSTTTLTGLHNGDPIPNIDATVVESGGNALEDTVFSITAVGHTHHNATVVISGHHSSNSHGKASFNDLTVDAKEQTGATLDFSTDALSGVTGQVTFDVAAGTSATDLQITSSSSFSGVTGGLALASAAVQVSDHHGRNGLGQQNLAVTWTLGGTGTGCSSLSFSAVAAQLTATSNSDASGIATSPAIVGASFTGSCTLTASRSGLTSAVFTLNP